MPEPNPRLEGMIECRLLKKLGTHDPDHPKTPATTILCHPNDALYLHSEGAVEAPPAFIRGVEAWTDAIEKAKDATADQRAENVVEDEESDDAES